MMARQPLLAVLDRAPIMIGLFAMGRLAYANSRYALTFTDNGLTCDDPEQQPRVDLALAGGSPFVDELELRTTMGTLWGRLHIDPLDDEGQVGVYIEDIGTQRAASITSLRSQRLQLLGRMASGVAHDVNNILTIIRVNAELLELATAEFEPESAELSRQQLTEAILEAVSHASRLTQQLLEFGRRSSVGARTTDLSSVLERVTRLAQRTLGRKHQLQLHIVPEDAEVYCDPDRLEAAVLNLLINARDASPAGGPISLALTDRSIGPRETSGTGTSLPIGDYYQVSVCDEGVGMSPELLSQIWEPFISTKDSREHAGMGLCAVLDFVTELGGAVDIESTPGQGTSVHLLLPRGRGQRDPLARPGRRA